MRAHHWLKACLLLSGCCGATVDSPPDWPGAARKHQFAISTKDSASLAKKGAWTAKQQPDQQPMLCKNDFNFFVAERTCAPQVDEFCDAYGADAALCKSGDHRYKVEHICCEALLDDFLTAFKGTKGADCSRLVLTKCVLESPRP